jgi:hypothetical protein
MGLHLLSGAAGLALRDRSFQQMFMGWNSRGGMPEPLCQSDVVHRRQEVEKKGQVLRGRAASHLRGSFGFSSDELVKFGVRPLKAGTRGPRKAKPAAATPADPTQKA